MGHDLRASQNIVLLTSTAHSLLHSSHFLLHLMMPQKPLVEMRLVPRPWPETPELIRRRLTKLRHHLRIASEVTMMPRSNSNSSTSRKLRQNRKESHPAWLMISTGNR